MRIIGFGPYVLGWCVVVVGLAGCATNSSMAPTTALSATSRVQSVARILQFMPTRSAAPAISGIQIPYQGGPVLVNPKTYLILWGYKKYGDPDGVAKLLREYLEVEGGSGHNNIYTQYYEVVSGQKTYITNPKRQSGGIWDDEKDAVALSPTDAQVASEALAGVAHFGYDVGGSYIVATPHGRSTNGFDTQWCAYHSDVYDGGQLVSYTNLPYIPDAGTNCGANSIAPPKDESRTDEGVTIVEGTEYGESITDPEPGSSWYDAQYGEIGICSGLHNDRFGNKHYTMRAMYSNATSGGSCVQSYK